MSDTSLNRTIKRLPISRRKKKNLRQEIDEEYVNNEIEPEPEE